MLHVFTEVSTHSHYSLSMPAESKLSSCRKCNVLVAKKELCTSLAPPLPYHSMIGYIAHCLCHMETIAVTSDMLLTSLLLGRIRNRLWARHTSVNNHPTLRQFLCTTQIQARITNPSLPLEGKRTEYKKLPWERAPKKILALPWKSCYESRLMQEWARGKIRYPATSLLLFFL